MDCKNNKNDAWNLFSANELNFDTSSQNIFDPICHGRIF